MTQLKSALLSLAITTLIFMAGWVLYTALLAVTLRLRP